MSFMNNMKVLFGSLSLLFGLFGMNVAGAIAQNLRSDRHLSDQEIQSLVSNFLVNNPEAIGTARLYGDRRSENEIKRINQFVSAWQTADPSIAPFLGHWRGYEESLQFYPSTTKGQICVVLKYIGRREISKALNIGKVSGDKLITDGELGKRVFVRRKRNLQQQNNSTSAIREVAYVGMFGRVGGKNDFSAYILPTKELDQDEFYINRLDKLGCTTNFPVINLNAGQFISNKHPVETTVLDFYNQYFSRVGGAIYPVLNLNRDKFIVTTQDKKKE
jgi:hypothetical protein